jgi:hypothetical protein
MLLSVRRDPTAAFMSTARRLATGFGPHVGNGRETLTMEGGLRDPPLPQPELVLARERTVSEDRPEFVVERALVVVARVVLQDMSNVCGVRDR